MGAAAVSLKPDVEIIVFLAIMLHKGPAAFGLTTFLLQQVCAIKLFHKSRLLHLNLYAMCRYFFGIIVHCLFFNT